MNFKRIDFIQKVNPQPGADSVSYFDLNPPGHTKNNKCTSIEVDHTYMCAIVTLENNQKLYYPLPNVKCLTPE